MAKFSRWEYIDTHVHTYVRGKVRVTRRGKSSERAILYEMEADGYDRRTAHSTACADDYDHTARGWKR
ncbi:hypothetical protein [Paenibacillus crassostreae]|uniref:hypothetical protein n=1 Tax=Paenibacillus crassostreae TaxID=1763538 RepID=UPI0012FDEDAF|nr:hypothetical protein [Paenibacillus crassostreae]